MLKTLEHICKPIWETDTCKRKIIIHIFEYKNKDEYTINFRILFYQKAKLKIRTTTEVDNFIFWTSLIVLDRFVFFLYFSWSFMIVIDRSLTVSWGFLITLSDLLRSMSSINLNLTFATDSIAIVDEQHQHQPLVRLYSLCSRLFQPSAKMLKKRKALLG